MIDTARVLIAPKEVFTSLILCTFVVPASVAVAETTVAHHIPYGVYDHRRNGRAVDS